MEEFQTYFFYHPDTGVYESAVTRVFDSPPENATTVPPDDEDHMCPVWGGSAWTNVPDFRGRWIYKDGEEPVRVSELGPVPDGWSLTPPAPAVDPDAEVKYELAQVDFKSIRSLRAVAAGNATKDDTDKLAELEAQAGTLRAQLTSQEE
jgi:hypothetical protein